MSFYRYVYDQDDSPINGLCSHEFFVLARAVSAMPPSIAIATPVLGGPGTMRVVLNSSSSTVQYSYYMNVTEHQYKTIVLMAMDDL